MNLIVDTSAIIAVIVNENIKDDIIRLTQGANLFAPKTVHWEIGNAISAMFKRKSLDIEQAEKVIVEYNKVPISFTDVDLLESIKTSHKYKIYAYDAYILECAKNKKAPILTLDNGLKAISRLMDIELLEV